MKADKQLRDACQNGQVNRVEALLAAGTSVDVSDARRKTALHHAAFCGHADVISILLSAGADVNSRDKERETPLHCATSCGHADVVSLLLAAGANKEVSDTDGETPLHRAASCGHSDVMSQLLDAEADVDVRDMEGNTPLHHAASCDHADVATLLLDAGANTTITNTEGERAKDIASEAVLNAFASFSFSANNLTDAVSSLSLDHTCPKLRISREQSFSRVPTDLVNSTSFTHKYSRIRKIGEGLYGNIFLCINDETGQNFALKQMDFVDGPPEAALRNEIDILKMLHHKNIVCFFGALYLDGNVGIAMEYAAQGSMRSIVKRNGPLENLFATDCLFQMLNGISYLHRKTVIYRSLNAGNILLTSEGTIKIADFGISKLMDSQQSGTSTCVGYPYWMAPEVIRGETYDYKVDIWGVGVTALELLTGHPPFFDRDGNEALFKIGMVKDMKDELEFPESVSSLLKDFIFNCVAVNPEQRPSADDALKYDLFSITAASSQSQSIRDSTTTADTFRTAPLAIESSSYSAEYFTDAISSLSLEPGSKTCPMVDIPLRPTSSQAATDRVDSTRLTGSYSRIKRIGEGGHGCVHLCINDETGQKFAVKEVFFGEEVKEKHLRALRNEIDMLQTLDHIHIVKFYGTYYRDSRCSVAMEYVEGGSLRSYIIKHGPLCNELTTDYLFQILTGISYLHREKIIHRDLKADNILITNDGTIKIADFGVSKRIVPHQSGPKSFVGTAYWMAPEVIRESSEIYTDKVDIWGIGMTAYELLTGMFPFSHLNQFKAMQKIEDPGTNMKHELILPETVNKPLKDFIFSCVSANPEQRPSADDALKYELFSSIH